MALRGGGESDYVIFEKILRGSKEEMTGREIHIVSKGNIREEYQEFGMLGWIQATPG